MAESDDIKEQLDKITAMMSEFESKLTPLVEQQKKFDAMAQEAYQEYTNKVAHINQQKAEINGILSKSKNEINGLKQQAQILGAKYSASKQAEEEQAKAEALQEEWLLLHDKWDKLTMGAPWREWAKDHQLDGAKKITGDMKVILADVMGLGKTLTSIITCDMVQKATQFASPKYPFLGEEKQVYDYSSGGYVSKIVGGIEKPSGRKVLYICPAPMIRNVEQEFRMWAPHRSTWFVGGMSKAERNTAIDMFIRPKAEYVVIVNYEAWRKDLSLLSKLESLEFDTIIVDEAHIIKDIKSIGYRGVKQLVDNIKPPIVIPMTGTPILNRPQELYALLSIVAPDQFYHMNNFLWDYCEQDDEGHWNFKPGGLDLISKKIGKHFLRRTKDQAGIQLPEKTVTIHRLQVDEETFPEQAKARKEMRTHAAIILDENKAITAPAVIALYTRLRQIETWPAGIELKDPLTKQVRLKLDVEESQKIDYIIRKGEDYYEGLIPEVVNDERVVLFSQFKAPLREIQARCERAGIRAVVLDGDTSADIKEQIRIDFDARYTPDKANAKWDVVLCNYKVGGVGMNLTAASQMIILDEEWNPGKRDQAYDRIHRIGQEKPVTIHVIHDEETIDDWLEGIMTHKEGLVEGFNEAMSRDSLLDFLKKNDNGSGLA